MPKGKAKQKRAGTAVPAAPLPIFTPPDELQHAKYQNLVTIFSRAFQDVEVPEGLWDLWEDCCNFEGIRRSIDALSDYVLSLVSRYEPPSKAYELVVLFVKRTLITANIHQPVFHSQHAVTNHTRSCMALLTIIVGDLTRSTDMVAFRLTSEVPEECLPDPATESYATLAPLHWHPRSIEIACRALLSSRDLAIKKCALLYMGLLRDPDQSGQEASSCASKADFHAVLEDPSCMKAILGVLQHRDHTHPALQILTTLVKKVAPGPGSTTCSSALSHLLSMGAAKPLASALSNLSENLYQQQEEKAFSFLIELVSTIHLASLHDLAVQ